MDADKTAEQVRDDGVAVLTKNHTMVVEDEEAAPTITAVDAIIEPKTTDDLADQTNFLPTKQVIMVFIGLSVALACSFLDQTM
jgi:hypothetical protein